MIREKSCGAVVFTKTGNDIKYLLVQSTEGIYGFPKGHMESGESEEDTALREVLEETGVKIELTSGFRKTTEYSIPKKDGTIKQVVYFLGEFQNQNVIYQREELTGAYLLNYTEAITLLQFENLKRILVDADDYIRKKEGVLQKQQKFRMFESNIKR